MSKVKFVRGFRQPISEEAEEAAKRPWSENGDVDVADDRWFLPSPGCFSSLPVPTCPDDWLAQYREDPQTCAEFAEENPWLSGGRVAGFRSRFNPDGRTLAERYPDGKVYLAQIGGDLPSSACLAPDFDSLVRFAEIYLSLPVRRLGRFDLVQEEEEEGGRVFMEVSDLPEVSPTEGKRKRRRLLRGSLTSGRIPVRCRRKGNALQLHCPSLLSNLKKFIPPDGLCFVGLTMLDLYESSPDLFVAGLASGMERVAVFSFARYDPCMEFSPEFWYDVKVASGEGRSDKARKLTVLARSCKLLVHETGHLLGLPHCVYYSCCMNGSGHLAEDFAQPTFLCPVCLRKLSMLKALDVEQRYRSLGRFFDEFGMREEKAWINKRLGNFAVMSDGPYKKE